MSIREKIDRVLKDYDVDWKIKDRKDYKGLKDELMIIMGGEGKGK